MNAGLEPELEVARKAELALEIFEAKCQAWCAGWTQHYPGVSPDSGTVLCERARLYADAREEAGLPRLTPLQAYLEKIDRKRRPSRTPGGRRRR